MLYKFIFFFILNVIFYVNFNIIAKFINLYDYPKKNLKIHLTKTPPIGGFLIFINLNLLFLFNILFGDESFFFENRILIVYSYIFFSIGYYDDKCNLNSNTKLVIFTLIILTLIFFEKNFIITNLKFSFVDSALYLKSWSVFFTALCILLFINAFNMFDGINLQSAIYSLFIFIIFIYKSIYTDITIVLIISTMFFLYLNFQGRCFLGNSGSLLISFIISYIIIKSYNHSNNFFADEIFLIMLVPGLELIRLAIIRIYNKQHPFSGDRRHIHHILIKKFNLYFSILVIFIPICGIYFLAILKNNFLIPICFGLLIYFFTIFKFNNN